MLFLVRSTEPKVGFRPFHWTREEYYLVAEKGLFQGRRVQLIDGEIIELSPPGSPHSATIKLVEHALEAAFGPGFLVRTEQPLHVPGNAVPQPDVAVVRGGARDYFDEQPTTALLVVEVSDTSLAFDSKRKAALYARAGIGEYWIVNLVDNRLEVYRKPVVDEKVLFGARYTDVVLLGHEDQVTPLAAAQSVIQVREVLR